MPQLPCFELFGRKVRTVPPAHRSTYGAPPVVEERPSLSLLSPHAGSARQSEDAPFPATDGPALMVLMQPNDAVAMTFLDPGPPPERFSAPESARRCLTD